MKKFSLVSTVFNEMVRLAATIRDIEHQSLKPAEIVITDAGSTDGTFEALHKWSLESSIDIIILQKKKCNVAEGRNLAIRNAACDLIVSTDFGCRFHPEWLESLVQHFDDPAVKVVGGNFSVLEQEFKSWPELAAYICANGYRNKMDNAFLPSSRSIAYYKHVWEKAGGYPEELTLAGDDTNFAIVLKKKGFKITLEPRPFVYWLRPLMLSGYLKEAKRYAIGDAESRDAQNIRNVLVNSAEFILRSVFLVLIISLMTGWMEFNLATVAVLLISIFGLRSYYRIFRKWWGLRSSRYNLQTLFYAFIFFDLSRLNYIYWYIKNLLKEPKSRIRENQRVSFK